MSRIVSRTVLALGVVATLVAIPHAARAQMNTASAGANASATVIAAIGIANTVDLDFGAIVPSGSSGTVTQSAAASPVRTPAGGVTLGSAAAVSPATFTVTGEGNATYAITLPGAPVTITDGGSNSMTIDAFSSSPNGTGTLSGGGSQTLYVGGRLNVGVNQPAGIYTGTFNVTVTYN